MTTIMYVSAILAVVIILTIIGVLSRYRRCKPNQVLVVYGKTGGEKKSAKLYHGGAAFVLPIIQSYDVLSMEPMQIDCKLTGALSSQNIRVDVPTTITVAISTNPEMTKNKYNGPRLHLGLIEEIKAAFIDFLPAGTVLY